MSAIATLPLTGVRARAAAALAPVSDSDPEVHVDVVDALQPPAILLVWEDPWLEADTFANTFGPGLYYARLVAICIAGRLEPGPGIEKLEQMASHVIGRLHADDYDWPPASAAAPRIFDIAAVQYLGCRVGYRIPVQIGGP